MSSIPFWKKILENWLSLIGCRLTGWLNHFFFSVIFTHLCKNILFILQFKSIHRRPTVQQQLPYKLYFILFIQCNDIQGPPFGKESVRCSCKTASTMPSWRCHICVHEYTQQCICIGFQRKMLIFFAHVSSFRDFVDDDGSVIGNCWIWRLSQACKIVEELRWAKELSARCMGTHLPQGEECYLQGRLIYSIPSTRAQSNNGTIRNQL